MAYSANNNGSQGDSGAHSTQNGTTPLHTRNLLTATGEERQRFFHRLQHFSAAEWFQSTTLELLARYRKDPRLWSPILTTAAEADVFPLDVEKAVDAWCAAPVWEHAIAAPLFVQQPDEQYDSLVREMLYPGCLTSVAAPRGTGKSMVALALAVAAATGGTFRNEPLPPARVLLLDRDNPAEILKRRLRSWGAEGAANLQVLTRGHAPSLLDQKAWATFPAEHYDVVLIDSLGAATEGVSEKEGRQTQEILATLKDLAYRGPAVLLLDNTNKTATSYRGRGEKADAVDILYEARDITGWVPPQGDAWWEYLPAAGDQAWASRASRRRGQTRMRLAFVPSKFRLGIEPQPYCLEIDLTQEPWRLTDVTEEITTLGANTARRQQQAKTTLFEHAAAALVDELHRRLGAEPMRKREAERFLHAQGLTWREATSLLEDGDHAVPQASPGTWVLQQLANQPGNPVAVVYVPLHMDMEIS